MRKDNLEIFRELYYDLELSHHPFVRMHEYLKWCFKGVEFKDKSILDIGGGNGIYSFYARYKGARYALNLEPFAAGSSKFNFDSIDPKNQLYIEVLGQTIQEYHSNKKFDVIIMHDSVNHLDESVFQKIQKDDTAFNTYKKLINKVLEFLSPQGTIIITDCSSNNFWGDLKLKNPFAPTIDWHLHHPPFLVKKLFEDYRFDSKLRWSPFKRFGFFGRFLSKFGWFPSYFMQSHFNLILNFNKTYA